MNHRSPLRLGLATLTLLACAASSWAKEASAAPKAPADVPALSFFKPAALGSVVLSPDGSQLAMVVPGPSGRKILVLAPANDPQRRKGLAQFDDADVRSVVWVNNKRLAFDVTDLSAEMAEQYGNGLYAIDTDGENFIWLVGRGAAVESKGHMATRPLRFNHRLERTLRDGSDDVIVSRFNIFDGPADPGSTSLLRMNTRTRAVQALEGREPRHVAQWATDAMGRPHAALSVNPSGEAQILAKNADDRWDAVADYQLYNSTATSMQLTGALPDGTLLVRAVRPGAERLWGLYTFSTTTKSLGAEPLVALQGFDVGDESAVLYDRSPSGKGRVAGVVYTSDAVGVRWFLPSLQSAQKRIDALLPNTNNVFTCDPCGGQTRFVVRAEADRQPSVYFTFDAALKDAEALKLIGASRPDVSPALMASMEFERIATRDGKSMPVWITKPKGKGPFATVVLVHGGPWVRGASWGWHADAQFLASRGYLVIEPEFRGSKGYGDAWFRASFKQWGQAMQDDVTDATHWAVKQGLADPSRLVLAGASYGGYATMMGLVKEPTLYQAGINWVGVTDIDLMYSIGWSDSNSVWKSLGMKPMVGDQDADGEMLRRHSPLLRAAEIQRPVLMAYGGEDRRVPLPHGTKMRDALNKAGKVPVEWVEYKLEGHGFALTANNVDFWSRVERFLAKHAPASVGEKK